MKLLKTALISISITTTSLADGIVSFGDWDIDSNGSGWAYLVWQSNETIAGFQLELTNVVIESLDEDLLGQYNWTTDHNDYLILSFAPGPQGYIPPLKTGEKLVRVYFHSNGGDIGFNNVIFADSSAQAIDVDSSDMILVYSCAADINNDSTVDITDLLEVVGTWGQINSPADINEDGIVNITDLLAVVDAWGPC